MSTTARTTRTSGKAPKQENSIPVKTPKSEVKTEPVKSLPTAEQMRFAQMIVPKNDDPALKLKIKQVMDATRKTEDEVCTALFDCDNDPNRAVTYLLEGGDQMQSEWLTKSKKKKNRTASVSKTDGVANNHVSSGEGEDWDTSQTGEVSGGGSGRGRGGGQDRERNRQRGGGPPRMRGRGPLENRSWRGRENKENERNLEEGYAGHRRDRDRPGRMSNGPIGGGRGGRGERMGSRTFQGRGAKSNQKFSCPIETWSNPGAEEGADKVGFPSPEDWDNEEYTGSLADSKVFTPSTGPEPPKPEDDHTDANSSVTPTPGLVDSLIKEQSATLEQQPASQLTPSPVGVGANSLTPEQSHYFSQLTQSLESYKNGLNSTSVGSVNASQTQYRSELTQPSEYKNAINNSSTSQSYSTIPQQPAVTQVSYPTTYASTSVTCSSTYNPNVIIYSTPSQELNSVPSQTIPSRSKPQRPRVPPPSKIPSTAVEMPPGDSVNSGIVFLDVTFGALEFGSGETGLENSVESATPTPVPTPTPAPAPTASTPTVSSMDSYTVTSTTQQTSIANALSQSQKISTGDSLIQAAEPAASSTYTTGTVNAASSVRSASTSGTTPSISELTNSKTPDVSLTYGSASETPSIYQSSSSGYQKTTAPVYQTPVSTYNSASYSTSQVTTSSASVSASVYNNSSQVGYASGTGGYTSANSGTTQSANSYPSTNTYSNTQQGTGTSYPYTTYPSGTSAAYQNNLATYPSHTIYGAYPSFQNSYTSTNPPTASSQQNHKISGNLSSNTSKDSQYDSVPASSTMTAPASITPVSNTSVTPSLGLAGSSQTATSTNKVATMSTMSKSGVVQNIPPGVQPMVGTQYMIGQAAGALPFYQQPPTLFSYEDIQILQQRMPPHMPAGYFDMGFQPQTTIATGREGIGSVAYTVPDARFTRADNNTSPVPSTLSQQSATQAAPHQPMMPQPYSSLYFYGTQLYPPNYQYAAPHQLYTPVATPATASGHGNANNAQYTKGPGTYSYGSGYETNSAADYTTVKVGSGASGYSASPAQTKSGSGVGTPAGANQSTPTDLTSNMYNKSHGTLSKVNSYDKQAFHSGTPPPFNHLTASQNSGLPHLFISPMAAPHQQHHSAIMHQPMHQDGGAGTGPRSQASTQQNKSGTKQNYNQSAWYPN